MKIEKTYVWNRGTKRRAAEYEDVTGVYRTPAAPFPRAAIDCDVTPY